MCSIWWFFSVGGVLGVAGLFARRRLCVLETTCVHALLSSRWLHSASPVWRSWTLSTIQLVVAHRGGLVLWVRLGWGSACSSTFCAGSCGFWTGFWPRLIVAHRGGLVLRVRLGRRSTCSLTFCAGSYGFWLGFWPRVIASLPICSHSTSFVVAFCLDFRPLAAALLPICSHSESVCRCCVCAVLWAREHCFMWSCSLFPVVVYRCLQPGVGQPCGNHFFTSFGTCAPW